MLMSEEEVRKQWQEKSNLPISNVLYGDLNETTSAVIDLYSLDDLFKYASSNNINTLFYTCNFIRKESLEIQTSTFVHLQLSRGIIPIVEKEILDYNEKLSRLDFSKPTTVIIYCIYNGAVIKYFEQEEWFVEDGFDYPEDACAKIVSECEERITTAIEDDEKHVQEGREKLADFLVSDPEFQMCTNKTLRGKYIREFINSNKYDKSLFFRKEGGWIDYSFDTFVEYVWKKYKKDMEIYKRLNKKE